MKKFGSQLTDFQEQEEECLRGIWLYVPSEMKVFIYENADVELNGNYTTACALCYVVGKTCGNAGCRFRARGLLH